MIVGKNKKIYKVPQKGKNIMEKVTLNPNNSANSAPVTIAELKSRVNDGGKYFIENVQKGAYVKWFDGEELYELYTSHLRDAIWAYNFETVKHPRNEAVIADYRLMLEHMLALIVDLKYYEVTKYGDFRSFVEYCSDCMLTGSEIFIKDYILINSFFNDQGYLKG